MSAHALGDVVVRARGLACRLLDRRTLLQLARSSGSSALASALEDLGYWPAPAAGGASPSAARVVDRTIEHEILRRMGILARWLGDRTELFAALFEREERDALRIRLRELLAGAGHDSALTARTPGGWPELRALRTAAARAADPSALLRALARLGSPYALPLAEALRTPDDDPTALETALDRTWTRRARSTAARCRGPLPGWVEDEIDLHNTWVCLAGGGHFLEGGRQLPRELGESIAAETSTAARRRQLARAFRGSALASVFEDPEAPLSSLEARTLAARIGAARRAARIDPIGPGPILEVFLRLQAERADLRCISWGIASGLAHETIAARLVAVA